jgi:hypothetical protein
MSTMSWMSPLIEEETNSPPISTGRDFQRVLGWIM